MLIFVRTATAASSSLHKSMVGHGSLANRSEYMCITSSPSTLPTFSCAATRMRNDNDERPCETGEGPSFREASGGEREVLVMPYIFLLDSGHRGCKFQWNYFIPELAPECSPEFTGTECNQNLVHAVFIN